MSGRRPRMARVAEIAADQEQAARGRWLESLNDLRAVDRQRTESLEAAGRLGDEEVPVGLLNHLVCAGARHLSALGDQRVEITTRVAEREQELQESTRKTRSLDRLVERLDEAEAERRNSQAAAELLDATVVRAARRML